MKVKLTASDQEGLVHRSEIIDLPFRIVRNEDFLRSEISEEFSHLKPRYPRISQIRVWIPYSLSVQLLNITFKKEIGGFGYVWSSI